MTLHIAPNEEDSALARVSGELLRRYVQPDRPLRLYLAESAQTLELPSSAVALLMNILEAMAAGQSVTLVPDEAELTTVQAAELLGVSRPFLIKLLEKGALPYRKVGTHRRIKLVELLRYKAALRHEGEAILDELVAEAQAHDFGYRPA
jgi:excisionase family DNA binding protein